MPTLFPRFYHTEDDDYAPRDYTYVDSVAEGTRLEQAKPIHRESEQAAVRHRAEPSQDDPSAAPRGYDSARRLPRAADGPAPAANVAYPRPRDNAFAQTPAYGPAQAEPLTIAQARQSAQPVAAYPQAGREIGSTAYPAGRQSAPADAAMPAHGQTGRVPLTDPAPLAAPAVSPASAPPPAELVGPDGSRYERAAAQEMPEWLRVAQQNNLPYDAPRRRQPPRVEPAPDQRPQPQATDPLGRPIRRASEPLENGQPSSARRYEDAGYPEELIARQRSEDQEAAERYGAGRKRHGAQLAAPPPPEARMGRVQRRTDPGAGTDALPPREAFARPSDATRRPTYAPRGGYAPTDAAYELADASEGRYPNPYQVDGKPQDGRDPWTGEPLNREPEAEEQTRPTIPYLGFAVFAAAALVVVLWILQMTYAAQRDTLLSARAETTAQLTDNHPFGYRELIEREALANNLHPAFVAAIVLNESSFNPQAESGVGARGLMQLMPETAEWVHGKMGLTDEYSFDQMYDPDTNVHYACWYLAFLAQRFHNDPILVSAAFHAGQTTVQNWLNDSRYSSDSQSISLDQMADGPTKSYATRVLKAYAVYRRLYYESDLQDAYDAASQALTTAVSASAAASPS